MRPLSSFSIYMTPILRRLESIEGYNDHVFTLLVNVGSSSPMPTGLPLQRLRSIQIQHHKGYSQRGVNTDWLVASMHLTCLKIFTASSMRWVV